MANRLAERELITLNCEGGLAALTFFSTFAQAYAEKINPRLAPARYHAESPLPSSN
jgi:hypothetical protein